MSAANEAMSAASAEYQMSYVRRSIRDGDGLPGCDECSVTQRMIALVHKWEKPCSSLANDGVDRRLCECMGALPTRFRACEMRFQGGLCD